MENPNLKYRADIDGLRAVAVLVVVVFHAFPTALTGGFVGVDVFFVISGYLITHIIAREFEQGEFSFVQFYARRARRIVPALVVVMLATWLLGAWLLLSSELANLGMHLAAGAAFASNLLLNFEAGYFDASAETKPLLHLWSLGVEEQFYLIWPVLLLLSYRLNVRRLWLVGVLLAISFVWNIAAVHAHPTFTFYMLPTRFWELLIGGALAYLGLRHGKISEGQHAAPGLNQFAGIAGLSLIGVSAVFGNADMAFPGWWAALPCVGAALIIHSRTSIVNRLLGTRPLVFVGKISYPLYLWHWPLLSFAQIAEERTPSIAIRTIAVVVAVVLAWATWTCIERPVQQRLFASTPRKSRARKFVTAGVGVLVVIGAAGALTYVSKGFPGRYPQQEAVFAQMAWNSGGASNCRARYGTDGICQSTDPEPRVLLWGESHAEMMLPGFASSSRPALNSVVLLGHYGCPPLFGVELEYDGIAQGCLSKNAANRRIIEQGLASVRTVVLISRGPQYFTGVGFGIELDAHEPDLKLRSREPAARAMTAEQLFLDGYDRSIAFLEGLGKEVVFFVDVPEIGFKPQECVGFRPWRFTDKTVRSPCALAADLVVERQKRYRELVAELQRRHPALRLFDATAPLCDSQLCYAMKDARVLYRDDDHLSAVGSSYVAEKLADWLTSVEPAATSFEAQETRNDQR